MSWIFLSELAAPFPDLYTMNFKNEKEWDKYKKAADKIKDKYGKFIFYTSIFIIKNKYNVE